MVGDVEIRAASVRGLLHRHQSTPRQDAYAVRADPPVAWTAAAVCDGLGSLPRSELAAHTAARRRRIRSTPTCSTLPAGLAGDLRLRVTGDRTGRDADAQTPGPCDDATCLVGASDPEGDVGVTTAWVGDSPAAALLAAGAWLALADGQPGYGHRSSTTSTAALPRHMERSAPAQTRAGWLDCAGDDRRSRAAPLGDGNTELGAAVADMVAAAVESACVCCAARLRAPLVHR